MVVTIIINKEDILQQFQMKKVNLCKDPKHLAWVTWTLLANNPVNKATYLIFCLIDFLIMLFYSFNLVQRLHFSNFDGSSYMQNIGYQKAGIRLDFIRNLDQLLLALPIERSGLLLALTIGILAGTVVILSILYAMALLIRNHSNLEKKSFFKQTLSLVLLIILTFLHMPIFDVITRTFIAGNQISVSLSEQVLYNSICLLTVAFFAVLLTYLVRLFNLCVPTDDVPWCAPVSKIATLNMAIKIGLIQCNAFNSSGNVVLAEILILLILQGFQASYRVLFAPNYVKMVDIVVKTKDFALCLVFFIGAICKTLGDQMNYDIVYFIIFVPTSTFAWILFERQRMQTVLKKIKDKSLRLEVENEYALYVMMSLVRDCQDDTIASQKVFGQLMDLMLSHIEDCDDKLCICDEMENFYELLRLRQLHNSEVFPLLRSERKRYKKIIDDQGLVGTVSNMTDVTLKLNTTQSTQLQNNNELDKLDRHAEVIDKTKELKKTKTQVGDNEVEKKEKNRIKVVYKINIDETKHRFLSELLYLFYYEMISKFPESFKIQLLSNYFALCYKKKEMLCVFQMRSFNKNKLPGIDHCCHIINEQYLLYEVAKVQKVNMHESLNQQDGNFNGDYFIRMNQLYKKFNKSIEALSTYVVEFWKMFERQTIDASAMYGTGTYISKYIQKVFTVFNELETLKISKDYQMYFQFAIIQLHILNDPVAYDLYIGKMKSILEINKIYQKNFSQTSQSNTDQTNFIIVDANNVRFGQIIQVNNNLRMLLGWRESDFRDFRIDNFMPALIRKKHQEFMVRYNKTGQSYIINNKVTMFIKKSNGYVIPVELYIKFHYSIDYQYTFLAIIRPFYEMSPFKNALKLNMDQLLFLIVDNEDGRITEYSESCIKLLGQYGFNHELHQSINVLNISDLIVDFNFKAFSRSRQERYITNEIYENMHKIDLNMFSDNSQMSNDHNKRQGNLAKNLVFNNGGVLSARVRIFEERYSGGVLDLNIFCFTFVNDNEGSSRLSAGHASTNSQLLQKKNLIQNAAAQIQNDNDEAVLQEVMEREDEQSQSNTGSNSSQSAGSSTTSMAAFRNFHSFTQQNNPKTLILVIRLIVALYFIMITIASVNLGISVQRQMQSVTDIQAVRYSYDRMNQISINQLYMRVLLNIANGYEPNNSTILNSRFNDYIQLQKIGLDNLQTAQTNLQQSSFTQSDSFSQFINGNNVPLTYLSATNQLYTKYVTLNVAFTLYLAKLNEINSFNESQMLGNLRMQTLNYNKDPKYSPTYVEQSLFFVVYNGNNELRQFAIDATTQYSQQSETHADNNITTTKITVIISILIILIIGVIIAPILTQAEIRKFKALLYFLKIPREKFTDLIKNCEYCLNMSDEKRYTQIMKDYESFLGIRILNQQVEQIRQTNDQKLNQNNQNERQVYSVRDSAALISSDFGSTQSSRFIFGQKNTLLLSSAETPQFAKIAANTVIVEEHSSDDESQASSHKGKRLKIESKPNIMMDHDNERDDDERMDQRDVEVNNNKLELSKLNFKANNDALQKKRKMLKIASLKGQDKTKEELDDIEQEHDEMAQKRKMVNAQAQKRRSLMIFTSLAIILFLSTYFIISYFLAQKTFQTAASVISSLGVIFYQGSCFDSAMNFLRESQIQNQSITINLTQTTSVIATDYYLEFCSSQDKAYQQFRVSLPAFFKYAGSYIQALEAPDMCEQIYTQENSYLQESCKNSLNGILSLGFSNAFQFMNSKILGQNLLFELLGPLRSRQKLEEMMREPTIISIIDVKSQLLDIALDQLKQSCMDSVNSYIQSLLNNSITAFIVFGVLLTVALVVLICVGFRIIRKSMWDTNIILKIIPFEMLPKKEQNEIKDFFNT